MYGQSVHAQVVDLADDGLVQSDTHTHMFDKRCSEKADVVSVWSGNPRSGLSRLWTCAVCPHTCSTSAALRRQTLSVYGQAIHEVDLVDYGLVQSDTHTHVRQALL